MPVPLTPREQWTHVLASVLALTTTEHRAALLRDFTDEDLPGVENTVVREFAPAGDDVIDIVVQERDKAWALAIQTSLAFGGDIEARLSSAASRRAALLCSSSASPRSAAALVPPPPKMK
jgi:hypothetical protein